MKRTGNVFDSLCSFENLYKAYKKALRGSGKGAGACEFGFHLEKNLIILETELLSCTYTPGQYRYFKVYEPKERVISVAPFRDRVVHHAIINKIEPLFEKTFIYDSYTTRKGKGTHRAVKRAQFYLNRSEFYLKFDINKYFDHYIKEELRVKRYIRYMDDCLVFSGSKDHLKQTLKLAESFLKEMLFLNLKEKATCIKPAQMESPFWGIEYFPL